MSPSEKAPAATPLALARLLLAIEEFRRVRGRDPYTRELLGFLGEWGFGEGLIDLAESLGLIYRYDDYCSPETRRVCRFNGITKRGLEFLRLVKRVSRLVGIRPSDLA